MKTFEYATIDFDEDDNEAWVIDPHETTTEVLSGSPWGDWKVTVSPVEVVNWLGGQGWEPFQVKDITGVQPRARRFHLRRSSLSDG